ncbi:hypothetical protein GCM10009001_14040 [Virgibacillus siamensis]|uniref:Transposase n=1 Tax=Virgibacillus siamensis TaxID=480071 RepID=A0ABN1FVZ4_9BACI
MKQKRRLYTDRTEELNDRSPVFADRTLNFTDIFQCLDKGLKNVIGPEVRSPITRQFKIKAG